MHLHPDSETEQWVLKELSLNKKLRSRDICVFACDGVVTLQGSAPSYSDSRAAEEATRGAPGVVSVLNEIRVRMPAGLIAERSVTSALVGPRSAPLHAQHQSQ